jgi:hypothetical protein
MEINLRLMAWNMLPLLSDSFDRKLRMNTVPLYTVIDLNIFHQSFRLFRVALMSRTHKRRGRHVKPLMTWASYMRFPWSALERLSKRRQLKGAFSHSLLDSWFNVLGISMLQLYHPRFRAYDYYTASWWEKDVVTLHLDSSPDFVCMKQVFVFQLCL